MLNGPFFFVEPMENSSFELRNKRKQLTGKNYHDYPIFEPLIINPRNQCP